MIVLNLSDYNLLTSLPETFSITQVEDSVTVYIDIDGATVFSTTLYPQGTTAWFYGLRSLVREEMRAGKTALSSLSIDVDYGEGMERYGPKYVVYSAVKFTADYDPYFLLQHFLVNRSFLTIPRSEAFELPYFYDGTESLAPYAACSFVKNGVYAQRQVSLTPGSSTAPKVRFLSISPTLVKQAADTAAGRDVGTLLSYDVHLGERSITVFVTDVPPLITFFFHNAFNVPIPMFIYGTENLKTDISRKEAVCLGVTSFYNEEIVRKHEIETVALSMEEAHGMNEFLESPCVTYDVSEDFQNIPVLISDITSEISDDRKEQVRLKFSWRFDDNAQWRVVEN